MKADKVIYVDAEVYDKLCALTQSWKDTPNHLMRRLLGLPPSKSQRGRPKKRKS